MKQAIGDPIELYVEQWIGILMATRHPPNVEMKRTSITSDWSQNGPTGPGDQEGFHYVQYLQQCYVFYTHALTVSSAIQIIFSISNPGTPQTCSACVNRGSGVYYLLAFKIRVKSLHFILKSFGFTIYIIITVHLPIDTFKLCKQKRRIKMYIWCHVL